MRNGAEKYPLILMRMKNVNPEWVLTGNGACFAGAPIKEVEVYKTGEEFLEKAMEEQALRQLSSRALAEELLRRIVISQGKVFCSDPK